MRFRIPGATDGRPNTTPFPPPPWPSRELWILCTSDMMSSLLRLALRPRRGLSGCKHVSEGREPRRGRLDGIMPHRILEDDVRKTTNRTERNRGDGMDDANQAARFPGAASSMMPLYVKEL